jgi:exosortase
MSTVSSAHLSADSDQLPRRWWVPLAVLAAALLVGHAPLAVLHLRSLWQQEQYQFFPFVLAAFGWLLYSRWQESPDTDSPPRWWSLPWVLLACSVLLLAGSLVLVSGWLAFVSLNVGVAALLVWLGRVRQIPFLVGIWALLWLLVPAPLGQDQRLVQFLQRLSSQLSSTILDVVGIRHLMSGNVVTLPDRELFVDEACSGIVSVMSIIACSMIYAVWRNRSILHLVLLTMAGVMWAVVMNLTRICAVAAAHSWFQMDLASGTPHEILGLCLFLLSFLALVSTDVLLAELLTPIDVSATGEQVSKNVLVRLWNWFYLERPSANAGIATGEVSAELSPEDASVATRDTRRWPGLRSASVFGVLFLLLGVLQVVWVPSPNTAQASAAVDRALAIDDSAMPRAIGPWEFISFEETEREAYSDFGKYSRAFRYRHTTKPGVVAFVSLDFPYLGGWHDLCMCYRGAGWETDDRNVTAADTSNPDWKYVDAQLTNPEQSAARVLFAGFDVSGEAAEPPSDAVLFRPWFRLRRRLLHQVAPQLFQVQVFTIGQSTGESDVEQDLQQLLFFVREKFREAVAE